MSERQCGGCTLCCKLLPIKENDERVSNTVNMLVGAGLVERADFRGMLRDFNKPAGKPCPHQRHGKGCAVYARRPLGCRYWSCRWLSGDGTADLRRPDRSRYVIDPLPDYIILDDGESGPVNIEVVQVWCDPKERDAWREPAMLAYLENRGKEGKAALIRFSSSEGLAVFPPSMSPDGQWREKSGNPGGERDVGDIMSAIGQARRLLK